MFQMKKLFLFFSLFIFAGSLGGCASIMRDSSQAIPVKSNVEKVDIQIADKSGDIIFDGQAPTIVTLKVAEEDGYFNPARYTITASKDGYQTTLKSIDWHVSKWYSIGNLAFGGVIGYLLIDPFTGKMFYLDEEVSLNMRPEKK